VNLDREPLPIEGEVLLASERLDGALVAGAAVWLCR
jgi:hypothetical protein